MYAYIILFASTLLVSCNSAFVDNLKKCSVKEDACLKDFQQSLWVEICDRGIPEINISPFEPFRLQNATIPLLDTMNVTMSGYFKGLNKCIFTQLHADLDSKTEAVQLVCDVSISGHFHFAGSNDFTENLLHVKAVEGDGDELIRIERLQLNVNYSKYPVKRNGVIYMQSPVDTLSYTFDADKLNIAAEHFLLGNNDISQLIVSYATSNWKSLLKTFGKKFIDLVLLSYYENVDKFLSAIPASKFILEDLSSYTV